MENNFKELVYRGIKYSLNTITEIKKQFFRKERNYRGTHYIIDEAPKPGNEFLGKRAYRGISY